MSSRAIDAAPKNPNMHVQQAWVFWHAKRFADAAIACDRALQLEAGHAEALRLRGMLPVPQA